MTIPTPPPLSDADVLLLADSRMDALRGQALIVGDHHLAIPEGPGPLPVPLEVARALLRQPGWRLADPADAARVAQARPPPAPVIDTPQATHAGVSRVRAAQVASPSSAEMAARERWHRPPEGDPLSVASVLAGIAAVAEMGSGAPAVAERAAVPEPAADTPPAPDVEAFSEPIPVADGGLGYGDISGTADIGGSSDPLD